MTSKREALKAIKSLERAAYPKGFQTLQDAKSWRDLEEYAEGSVHHLLWDDGYCLWTDSEVVDLASIRPVSLARLGQITRTLRQCFGERVVSMDCRATTSHRLMRYYQRKGVVEVLSEYSYEWDDELFYEVQLRFLSTSVRESVPTPG